MTGPNDNPFDDGAWDDFPDPPPRSDSDADLDRWRERHPIWTGPAGQFQDAHGYVRDAVNGRG